MTRGWAPVCLAFCMLLASGQAWGKGRTGVSLELSAGYPQISLKNSDNEIATYRGLAFGARGFVPVISYGGLVGGATISYRLLEVANTANNGSQKEEGSHAGPGGGLRLAFYRLFAGGEFHAMKADHLTVGEINSENNFRYSLISYYAGFLFPIGKNFDLAVSYNKSTANIPQGQDSETMPYEDSVIWFRFTVNFQSGFFDLLK